MKNKTILISTILLLILAVTAGAIAYASWDNKAKALEMQSISVASNVNLNATIEANSADTTHNLIPSVATIKNANKEVENLKIGKFSIALSSDLQGVTYADLKSKITDGGYEVNWTVDEVYINSRSDSTKLVNGSKKWSDYVTVTVTSDAAGNAKLTKLTLGNNASDNVYYVFIKFNDFSKLSDTNEQAFIKSLMGKKLLVNMTISIDKKAA